MADRSSNLPGQFADARGLQEKCWLSLFPTRRKFLQIGAAGIAAGGLAIVGDATFFEATHPILVSIDIHLPRLTDPWDGFRIAQLSDFHYDDYFSVVPLKRAIDIVNGLKPDLAVLTGDFVTSFSGARRNAAAVRASRAVQPCAQLLAGIRAASGVLAILGNHDVDTNAAHIIEVLATHDIPVLRNRSVAFERDGKRLWFAGVDDVLNGKPRLDLALQPIPEDEPVVLLAHEPDWADHVAKYPVDLQLAGHSHGGQIRIPLLGAPYLPPMARKYPCGFHQIGRLALYTNAGIGTIAIPLRLDCPPEVTLITLRKSPVVSG
jgi:predicted MPP superfamily phosphohydrolase